MKLRQIFEQIQKTPLSSDSTDIILELDIGSNLDYEKINSYQRYEIYRTKKKFKDKYFIARAIHPRTRAEVTSAAGENKNAAEKNLHIKLDQIESNRKPITNNAIVDFNVEFATKILSYPDETFYAKIVSGPKLVIAGNEMLEYPEIMRSDGFKRSSVRNIYSPEGSTKVPSIPLNAKQAKQANIIDNGRYILGDQSTDKDGNLVFDLEFDSQVYDTRDKMRIKKPALTIGTQRSAIKPASLVRER